MKKWSVWIPDVFADADANGCISDPEDRARSSRLKITELIKDSVVRQKHLVVDRCDSSALDDGSRIENVVLPIHESDDCRDVPSARHQILHCSNVGVDELRLEKQILGWVSGECEFGECNNIG